MDSIRVVPDPLVFPHYEGEYSSEGFIAVTPGQTYSFTVGAAGGGGGAGGGGSSFSWKVPPGVTNVNVQCFGGGGAGSANTVHHNGRGGVYSLGGIAGKAGK